MCILERNPGVVAKLANISLQITKKVHQITTSRLIDLFSGISYESTLSSGTSKVWYKLKTASLEQQMKS